MPYYINSPCHVRYTLVFGRYTSLKPELGQSNVPHRPFLLPLSWRGLDSTTDGIRFSNGANKNNVYDNVMDSSTFYAVYTCEDFLLLEGGFYFHSLGTVFRAFGDNKPPDTSDDRLPIPTS